MEDFKLIRITTQARRDARRAAKSRGMLLWAWASEVLSKAAREAASDPSQDGTPVGGTAPSDENTSAA